VTGSAAIVSIIFVLGALVLALRGLKSHRLSAEKKAWMAAIWVLIIAGAAFLFSRLGF
jgi:hypothetical protein